jgi:glucose-1-phosphate thymidylyltransferase
MKVIIPMAGLGARMRPHTFSRPKPLINVAGQPFLKHLIDKLETLDPDEYIFIVGYLGDQIERYIREHYDFKAHFVVQEELVGQSHAIYLAREHLDGPAIVMFADTLFEADLSVASTTDADAIAFVKQVDDPRRFGVIELDSAGRVTRFIEKPESTDNKNVVIGLYYVQDSRWMIRAIETQMAQKAMTKGEFYLTDTFQIMVNEGAVFRTQGVSVWLDIGKPETTLETNRYLLEHGFDNSAQVKQEGVTIIPPVNIHPDARFEHAVIGPHAVIGAGCRIRYSIIKDSIVDDGAQIDRMILDNSLIGRSAQVKGRYFTLNVGETSTVDFT